MESAEGSPSTDTVSRRPPEDDRRSVRTDAFWIGPVEGKLMAWLTQPPAGPGDVGVVIVPPLGYESFTTHRTVRALAERLALIGCSVVRIDLDGTGDSWGEPWDPDRVLSWRASLHEAATFLTGIGCRSLVVAGVRFGATLALTEGADMGADRALAWAPVVKGRTFVRELTLLGDEIPDDHGHPGLAGGVVQAGSAFDPQTLAHLRTFDLTTLSVPPAVHVLVIDRDDQAPSRALVERISSLDAEVDHLVLGGSDTALDRPTEYAEIAGTVVDAIVDWVGPSGPSSAPKAPTDVARREWTSHGVTERVVRLGRHRLVGVLTEPDQDPRCTILWLNTGSEPHVGTGRAWVDFARDLATHGYASVRLDFSGFGESPDLGHAPGRPYDAHCRDEVVDVAADLHAHGHRKVVVAGLCAGAWVGLAAATDEQVDGVIAINPQLYWQPGDPVEASIVTETRPRRQAEIRRFRRIRRTGAWWALDALGVRHPAARRLRSIDRAGVPVLAVFAEGDDGLEFLEDRVGRTWAHVRRHPHIEDVVVPDIDHSMHRIWLRPAMAEVLKRWLDRFSSDG
jgi:pimeloyl-ACP methyl ester carboxylesterase